MAEQYDGSIRINTEIDTRNVSSQMLRLINETKKTTREITDLKEKMDSLAKSNVPTDEYKQMQAELKKAEAYADRLYGRLRVMEKSGDTTSAGYRRLVNQIKIADQQIDNLRDGVLQLEASGKAFIPGANTAEYKKMAQQVEDLDDKLAVSNRRLEEMRAKQQPVEQSYNRMKNAAAQMSNTVKQVGANTKKSFSAASTQAKKMTKSVNNAHMGFGKMLAMSVAFSAVFRAISAITSGVTQGFTNLMGYSSDFANTVQSLKNALATLGNAFATAFAPIISFVVPALNTLISALSTAMTYVAQFIAVLGGNSTFIRAKKVQDSYNDSLNGTASAAKKASGALAKFDDLDVLQKQDDTGGGGGAASPGDMFEEVPVDPAVVEWIDNLKNKLKPLLEYAKELKDVFMEGFWDGLGDYEYRFEAIKKGLQQIKDALIDIGTDPAVLAAADAWAKSFMYMLGSLAGSVASIGLSLATALIGGLGQYLEDNTPRIKKWIVSMFDVGADVNMLLADLFQSVAYIFEAFASESGIRFVSSLIGVIADSYMGVTEIAWKIGRDFLQMLILPITENEDAFKTALEGLLSSAATVLEGLKAAIDSIFDNLNTVYDEHFAPFFQSIANGLSSIVGTILDVWNNSIQPIVNSVATRISDLLSEYIAPFVNSIVEFVGNLLTVLQSFWESFLLPIIEMAISYVIPMIAENIGFLVELIIAVIAKIIEGLTNVMNFINETIMPAWQWAWEQAGIFFEAFFDVISAVGQLIKDLFSGITKFIKQVIIDKDWKGAWDTAKQIFETFKTNIRNIIDAVKNLIKTFVDWVSEKIQWVLDKIASIPSGLISGPLGSLFGGNEKAAAYSISYEPGISADTVTSNIPHLASGAVIQGGRPFAAILGDQPAGRTNVEAPLSTIEEALENVMSRMGEDRTPLVVNINYDGETFARLSLNDILAEASRQGYNIDILGWTGG